MISSRQPEEILRIVERYQKDMETAESNYLDIVIRSEGTIGYKDIMGMPVDSIKLLIERMNHRVEEINKNNARAARR